MTGAGPGASKLDAVARAHAQLLRQTDLQFAFVGPPKIPPMPNWLKALLELLRSLAPLMKWVFWAGLAALAVLVLYFVLREVMGLGLPGLGRRKSSARPVAQAEWRPAAARARTLLEDADRLAAQGLFDQAAHLILFRSIEDIDRRWPRQVQPALTSRDIARLPMLPPAARETFAGIARTVEQSFFGGQPIGPAEFEACRHSYQAFALPAGA